MALSLTLAGILSFFGCLLFHVILWRLNRPRNDSGTIFVIFLFIPPIFAVAARFFYPVAFASIFLWYLLHFSLSGAYIATYPVFQAISPSLEILLIMDNYPEGLEAQTLLSYFNDRRLVKERVRDLLNSRLAKKKTDTYHLSPVGFCVIRTFIAYRKILGLGFQTG